MSIVPLLFEGEQLVRTIDRDGEPWFVAADVCRVLEIGNPTETLRKLDEDEVSTLSLTEGAQGGPPRNIVNESGLYTLVLRCRDATTPGTVAHRFRKWVTAEVLPTLRRTGVYAPPPPAGAGPAFPAWTLEELRAKRNLVETSRMLDGLAGARWMAERLGFPRPPAAALAAALPPSRAPVEAWWHARLQAGTTTRAGTAWAREVAIDALFADYCIAIGEGGPQADRLRNAWAARLRRLVPSIRITRIHTGDDGRPRQRLYVLPPLDEARAMFGAVTGEAPAWGGSATS